MEGFNNKQVKDYPNFKDVFELLDDADVFRAYLNCDFSIGSMNSPIGAPDRHASFSIFYNHRKSKFMFKEHRYGYIGDCIDFVKYLFSYPSNRKACMRIMHDFGQHQFQLDDDITSLIPPGNISNNIPVVIPPPREIDIRITIRDWEDYDIEYWKSYGVSKKWLDRGSVYPISFYFINGHIRVADKYAYAYVEYKDMEYTYKVYQPYSTHQKWLSNNNGSVWELWECLPDKYDTLIITKSRKDGLSIMSTMGIPSTALQSEGTLPKEQVVDELKRRFLNIYLLYDNDFDKDTNYGMEYSKKLVDKFGFKHLIIPSQYGEKDYSDLVKRYSEQKAVSIIRELINKI